MNFNINYLVITFSVLLLSNHVKAKPDIVIVGGGPIGYITAAEALKAGATSISVLEKRPVYTREQLIVLRPDDEEKVINILGKNKWNRLIEEGKFGHDGVISIKYLEQALEDELKKDKRFNKINGEFKSINDSSHDSSIVYKNERGSSNLRFDMLVGADGTSRKVAQSAGFKYKETEKPFYSVSAIYKKKVEKEFDCFTRCISGKVSMLQTKQVMTMTFDFKDREAYEKFGQLDSTQKREEFNKVLRAKFIDIPSDADFELESINTFETNLQEATEKSLILKSGASVVNSGNSRRTPNYHKAIGIHNGIKDAEEIGNMIKTTVEELQQLSILAVNDVKLVPGVTDTGSDCEVARQGLAMSPPFSRLIKTLNDIFKAVDLEDGKKMRVSDFSKIEIN